MMMEIKTKIRRKLTKRMDLSRLGSWPYVTADGFRSIADHILDESFSFESGDVIDGDIIFVRNDYLGEFFEKKFPTISKRIIIIVNGDDYEIPEIFSGYLDDDRIIRLFSANCSFVHKKLDYIPLGIGSRRNGNRNNRNISLLKEFSHTDEKVTKIFSAFNLMTQKEHRTAVINILKESSLADIPENRLGIKDYMERLARSMFAASPRGNGLDCHRTWEALYLKTVPIVERMPMTEYFKSLGLPIYIVDDWKEILELNDGKLSEIYKAYLSMFDTEAIWMPYWQKMILGYKNTR